MRSDGLGPSSRRGYGLISGGDPLASAAERSWMAAERLM
jgi:hypothetical protein